MATLIKRGDAQWQAKVRKKGYPVQSKTFKAKARAAQWARTVESEWIGACSCLGGVPRVYRNSRSFFISHGPPEARCYKRFCSEPISISLQN